jgi:lysophospholipase L1-like esterase
MTIQSTRPNAPASNLTIALSLQSRPLVGQGERGPSSQFIASTGVAFVLALTLSIFSGASPASAAPAAFKTAGDWDVQITFPDASGTAVSTVVQVSQPDWVRVTAEKYDSLPVFNPRAGGWVKGAQLVGVRAQETTTPYLLEPGSLVLRAGPEAASETFRKGEAYEADLSWGTFGRTTNSVIKEKQPVYASYRHAMLRLDAIVLTTDGRVEVRQGKPLAAAPLLPKIGAGERHLGNIWLPGVIEKLSDNHLFPIFESAYPEPPKPSPTMAEKLTPKALKRLRSGESLRILAWGDSVTVGTYVPDWQRNRWQEPFVARLKERFSKAKIELVTEAWGGRNTGSYLAQPPGAEHNYKEKVLDAKPDLVVSEFVNDAGLNPEQVEKQYSKFLADFQAIGAEWIILTPHYVRPDWMGLTRERDIDDDPRPYVTGLRQFSAKHNVALADAALRYGRLWRQGIPYTTVMLNSINHPDARGMKLFADALMELFP